MIISFFIKFKYQTLGFLIDADFPPRIISLIFIIMINIYGIPLMRQDLHVMARRLFARREYNVFFAHTVQYIYPY